MRASANDAPTCSWTLTEDPREGGPTLGDEKATLAGFLRFQRLTLELKCAGTSTPSSWPGVRWSRRRCRCSGWYGTWPRWSGAGSGAEGWPELDVPRLYQTEDDRTATSTGRCPTTEVVAEAWRAWREEVAFAEAFVAGGDRPRPVYEIPGHGAAVAARGAGAHGRGVRAAQRPRRPAAGAHRRPGRPVATRKLIGGGGTPAYRGVSAPAEEPPARGPGDTGSHGRVALPQLDRS